MGNCNDKVAPNSGLSKIVCQEDDLQEGEMVGTHLGP
jgi:hypothetical protein